MRKCVAAVATVALVLLAASSAQAEGIIKRPGDHPRYTVEVEPHAVFGFDGVFAFGGYGLGGRFSIPIVQNGFIPSINNSVAIGFGLDFIHYDACYQGQRVCGANYFWIPIVMQWNFFVHERWSVFGEPGLAIYHGVFPDCAGPGCVFPTENSLLPALYLGARYHMSEGVALTMRIGYPAFSVGVSFFP